MSFRLGGVFTGLGLQLCGQVKNRKCRACLVVLCPLWGCSQVRTDTVSVFPSESSSSDRHPSVLRVKLSTGQKCNQHISISVNIDDPSKMPLARAEKKPCVAFFAPGSSAIVDKPEVFARESGACLNSPPRFFCYVEAESGKITRATRVDDSAEATALADAIADSGGGKYAKYSSAGEIS